MIASKRARLMKPTKQFNKFQFVVLLGLTSSKTWVFTNVLKNSEREEKREKVTFFKNDNKSNLQQQQQKKNDNKVLRVQWLFLEETQWTVKESSPYCAILMKFKSHKMEKWGVKIISYLMLHLQSFTWELEALSKLINPLLFCRGRISVHCS